MRPDHKPDQSQAYSAGVKYSSTRTALPLPKGSVSQTCLFADPLFLRKITTDTHVLAQVNTGYTQKNGAVTEVNPLTPNAHYSGRTTPLTSKVVFYIFIQQIQVLNILNMVYTLRFFLFKCSLFHNSNTVGSCIIHILYTGCAKIKKKKSVAKRLMGLINTYKVCSRK